MRRVAIQMDPIAGINPKSDSTLLLMVEAQKRGFELYYYTPDKLTYRDGAITAHAQKLRVFSAPAHYYELGESITIDLATMNVILLRQDPPFDMAYLSTTYILEQLPKSVLVVNDPASVRNCAEKIYPTLFRQFMPPTLISADLAEIERFRKDHNDIVIKPLYGHGGHAVFHLKDHDNFHALLELFFQHGREPLMVQKFLPEVKNGERRIILIDGEIGGIVGRIPAEQEIRANFRVGGTAAKVEITPGQQRICEALKPSLKEKGLIFAGIDVIGDYLTEINLTSPTGLAPINALYGKKLEAEIWNAIEARL